jgi:hypothetical protein
LSGGRFILADQSFKVWGRINPGFIDEPCPASGTLAEDMNFFGKRQFKYPTKEFNKRADGFSEFVEYKAKFDSMMKMGSTKK